MNKILLFITLCISLLNSCRPNIETQNAVRYNNIAILFNNINIDSALYYFDKAIAMDSNYLIAYQNKANLLIKAERYLEALSQVEILSSKIENSETLRIEGLLCDITKDTVSARVKYIKAIDAINEEIKRVSDFSKYQRLYQKGTILLLLNEPKEGIELIKKYSSKANINESKKDSLVLFQNNKNEILKILIQN